MTSHDIGVDMVEMYRALGTVLGGGPTGTTTIFEIMEDIHDEHGECDGGECPWKKLMDHIGSFTCDAITLIQAYAHAVIISQQGGEDHPEEAIRFSFETIENRMECLSLGTSGALRAYAKWCAQQEVAKQMNTAGKDAKKGPPELLRDCDPTGAC